MDDIGCLHSQIEKLHRLYSALISIHHYLLTEPYCFKLFYGRSRKKIDIAQYHDLK